MFYFVDFLKKSPEFVKAVSEFIMKYYNMAKNFSWGMAIVATYIFLLIGFAIWVYFVNIWDTASVQLDFSLAHPRSKVFRLTSEDFGPGGYTAVLIGCLETLALITKCGGSASHFEDKIIGWIIDKVCLIPFFSNEGMLVTMILWFIKVILYAALIAIMMGITIYLVNLLYIAIYPMSILRRMKLVDKDKVYTNYIAESRYTTIFWLFSWPIFDSHCDNARYWIAALIYPWFLPYIVLKDIKSIFLPSVFFKEMFPAYKTFITKYLYRGYNKDRNPIWPV